MNLLKEIDGNGWTKKRAILSTFPFDPRFFSRFVQSRLSRADCSLPLVYVDEGVYNDNIGSEWRTEPIGDDYLLEPVSTPGVFHPKVNLFASSRSVYFTVSSANISLSEYCDAVQLGSSGALQRTWLDNPDEENLEVANVATGIRDFYFDLGSTDWVTGTDAIQYTEEIAEELSWLDDAQDPEDRSTRFLHNLHEPILDQVLRSVGDVDRAVLSAPYFGSVNVLEDILDDLGASHVDLIVENGNTNLEADHVDELPRSEVDIRELRHDENRWVHAKFLILTGPWGSAVLYGSPNMTGAALSKEASRGNLEAALFRQVEDKGYFGLPFQDELGNLSKSPFVSSDFGYQISAPVSPTSIDVRSESYEDWERSGIESRPLRLQDARLSSPDEGQAKLTLTLWSEEFTGARELSIDSNTDVLSISTTTTFDSNPVDVTRELSEDQRSDWAQSVVVVEDLESGARTNPRRVTPETQAYLTEFRELTDSGGRQGARDLLEKFLFDNEITAGLVLEEGIEFLVDIDRGSATDSETELDSEESTRQWREQRFRALSRGTTRKPRPGKVVKDLLTHYLRQADSALDADPAGIDDAEDFVAYMESYWDLIEILQVACGNGIVPDGVVEGCEESLRQLYSQRKIREFQARLGDLIDRIEMDFEEVESDIPSQDVSDHPVWEEVFRVLYSHPAFSLDIGVRWGVHFIPPHILSVQTYHAFTEMTAPVLLHLFDPQLLGTQRAELEDGLHTRLGDRLDQLDINHSRGHAVMLFNFLLREGEDSILGLSASPEIPDPQALAQLAIVGRDELGTYELGQQKILLAMPEFSSVNHLIEDLADGAL